MSETVYYIAGGAVLVGGSYLLYDYLKNKDNPNQSVVSQAIGTVRNTISNPASRIPNPLVTTTRTHWPGSPGTQYNEFATMIKSVFETDASVPCIMALASVESMNGQLREACWNNNLFNFHVGNPSQTAALLSSGEIIRAFGTGYDPVLVRECLVALRDEILRSETLAAAKAGEIDTFQYCLGRQNYSATATRNNSPNGVAVIDPYLFNRITRMRNAGMISDVFYNMIRR